MRNLSTQLARIPLNVIPILIVGLLLGIWWITLPPHPLIPTYPAAVLREDHDFTVTDSGTASISWSILETTEPLPVVRTWYMDEALRLGWQEVYEAGMIDDITYGTGSDGRNWPTYFLGIKFESIGTGTRIITYLKRTSGI